MAGQVKVKICGITRAEDASSLDALGVHYLGFNFWPESSRYIPPGKAAPMVSRLKGATAVAVFVNASPEEIKEALSLSGIRMAQLHGQESKRDLEQIAEQTQVEMIKAVPASSVKERPDQTYSAAKYLLFDSRVDGRFGGTGKAFDWKLLETYRAKPYFLAGGLGPENLEEALKACRPYAVDLNSRVETRPGCKDLKKVEDCLEILGHTRRF